MIYTYISWCEVTPYVLEVRSHSGHFPIVHFRMTISRVTPNYSENNLSEYPSVNQNTFCTVLRRNSGRLCENLTINRQSQNTANYSILLVFLVAGNIYTESDSWPFSNLDSILGWIKISAYGLGSTT